MPLRDREIITNTALSSTARLLLLWLRATANKSGVSDETSASIGKVFGITVQRVSEIARELTDAGFVRRERAGPGYGTGGKRWVLLPTASEQESRKGTLYAMLPLPFETVVNNRPGAA